jgi:membrane associated rhomboid family serine protease
MPYVCKFCKGRYCAAHRLPENHDCAQLEAHRERVRAEGRVFAPPQEARVTPRVATTARAGASFDAARHWLNGKMHLAIIATCVVVYILQFVVLATGGVALHERIFTIGPDFLSQPWTIITNIFAHSPGNIWHIIFNMLGVYFFGSFLERQLGTARFTILFMGSGILAGIAQATLVNFIFPCTGGCNSLGASGAIMGLVGALVVLAPKLTVRVYGILPVPMWALGVFYLVLDLAGALNPGDGVGHYAHLAGFASGAAFGYYLRQVAMRRVVRRPPTMYSR